MKNLKKFMMDKDKDLKSLIKLCDYSLICREKRKILVLHHGDMDGSGIVIFLKIINNYKTNKLDLTFITCPKEADSGITDNYDDIFNNKIYTDIIISDLSIRDDGLMEKMNILNESGTDVILLDHHESALKTNIINYDWAYIKPHDIDNNLIVSGTSLAFDFIIKPYRNIIDSEVFAQLVSLTHDISYWDTWAWKKYDHTPSFNLNNIFTYYGIYNFSQKIHENILFKKCIMSQEEIIINKVLETTLDKNCYKAMCNMKVYLMKYNEENINVGFIITENNVSNISDYIFDNYSEKLDVIISYNIYFKAFSFRSRRVDLNMTEFAKLFSNTNSFGGHPQASGCTNTIINHEVFSCFEKLIEKIESFSLISEKIIN